MLELKYKSYHHPSYEALNNCNLQIPKLCPCCGVAHNPTTSFASVNNISGIETFIFYHQCPNCNQTSLSLNTPNEVNSQKNVDLLLSYPNANPVAFDERIMKVSPRFVSLYNQAHFCEENNYTDLAGMGYRAAMEVLLKDYALDAKLETKENIAKLNLNRAIDSFLKTDITAQVASDVVRIIGNDFTHWDRHEEYSLEELKIYLDIFINSIIVKIMINYPPVSRHQK